MSILRCSAPYNTLAWLRMPYLALLSWFTIQYTRALRVISCIPREILMISVYPLSGLPSAALSPVYQRSGRNDRQWVEGDLAGITPCLRYQLAKCPEGVRVPPHSRLVTIPVRRQGGRVPANAGQRRVRNSTMRGTAPPPAPIPECVPKHRRVCGRYPPPAGPGRRLAYKTTIVDVGGLVPLKQRQ